MPLSGFTELQLNDKLNKIIGVYAKRRFISEYFLLDFSSQSQERFYTGEEISSFEFGFNL